MTDRDGSAEEAPCLMQVIDLRLVRRRDGTWKLLIEGVEHTWDIGSQRIAEYLANRAQRSDVKHPSRLWARFFYRKPDGHP